MATLRTSITKFPVVYALIVALFVIMAIGIVMNSSEAPAGPSVFEQDLQVHQDGDPPPRCRPASKYAGDPHPSDPECKHKPEKHL